MKTIKTYIAIATCLLTFTGLLAQNTIDESAMPNSDYLEKMAQDEQELNNKIEQPTAISTPNSNRLAAAELINYQAVARDAGGNLMTNAAVTIDFEIRDGAGGAAVYNETQNLNTDANGVFAAQIGAVTTLAGVNWLNIEPWLHVTMDGTDVGETAMASVPTALHSRQSGAVMIYGSGSSNADKMIASHSPAFPNWGIGYNDANDNVEFLAGGSKTVRVALGSGNLSTDGSVEVLQTTTTPILNRVYGNSAPIAYASVDATGGISTGYGITSVTNSAVGIYDVVLNHDSNPNNTLVSITPFTSGIGTPEICGYEATGANTFTVYIQTTAGAGRDSAFSFVVYGNH